MLGFWPRPEVKKVARKPEKKKEIMKRKVKGRKKCDLRLESFNAL